MAMAMARIMNETQEKMVLEHLEAVGSITSRDAIVEYGITRLAAVVWVLRHKRGYNITSHDEWAVNRYGRACHYTRYTLEACEDGV